MIFTSLLLLVRLVHLAEGGGGGRKGGRRRGRGRGKGGCKAPAGHVSYSAAGGANDPKLGFFFRSSSSFCSDSQPPALSSSVHLPASQLPACAQGCALKRILAAISRRSLTWDSTATEPSGQRRAQGSSEREALRSLPAPTAASRISG
eukprot:67411-Hanusia_phi.AAC.2